MVEYLVNHSHCIPRMFNSGYNCLAEVAAFTFNTGHHLYRGFIKLRSQLTQSSSSSPILKLPRSISIPHLRLLSVVCGFPKDTSEYSEYKGQFGEDAYFKTSTITADTLGVADGVGGWSVFGIDPGQFSRVLMRSCERFVHTDEFEPDKPDKLLARAYLNLKEQKQPVHGSCTACVLSLKRDNGKLYAANIGDSGLLVIRNGAIVCRTLEQQHYFNTPYQLAIPPPGHHVDILTDGPECAELLQFKVRPGDIIILATDGVYDNIAEELLLKTLRYASGTSDPISLQFYANAVALLARTFSINPDLDSPFSENARRHNIDAPGGKLDDITVILASII